jgi:hypothetical protein
MRDRTLVVLHVGLCSRITLHSRTSRSLHACRAYNIINGQMYTITETINVTIDEYIP